MGLITRLVCVFAWLPMVSAQAVKAQEPMARSAPAQTFEDKTGRIVEHFNTSGRTLAASVIDLAYRYQLPMALEYVDHDAMTRPLNLQFHKQSVRQILEGIVRQAPQYQVTFSNAIVDIFAPKARQDTSNLFNKIIRDFSVAEVETRQADFQLFCTLAQEIDSSRCGGSLAGGQWEPIRITLHLENAKVYEVLNAIVAQNGKAIWTVTAGPKVSNLRSGGCWYIYPLQESFEATVAERLTKVN